MRRTAAWIGLCLFGGTLQAQVPKSATAAEKAAVTGEIQQASIQPDTSGTSLGVLPAARKFNHKRKIRAEFDRFKNRTTVTAEINKRGFLGLSGGTGPEVVAFFSH